MSVEHTPVLIIGGGQAGLAASANLKQRGLANLVLERDRIAERWRSARWDSLVANGPAWHDRFPVMEIAGVGPDEFASKEGMAAYFEAFAAREALPVRCGVTVHKLRREGQGFVAETSAGTITADQVVVATGPFQRPLIPAIVPEGAGVAQIHSTAYRNPEQLAAGAVLVVGGGSSGAQIAEELGRAGRKVYLSVGPHDRPPRRYRGRDFVWWLGALGKWEAKAPAPGTEHVTIAVSGAYGGQTMDFRRLAQQGITLLGRTEGYDAGAVTLAGDIQAVIERGDANYLSVLDEADAYISAKGLDFPEEPAARTFLPMPDCATHPILRLDLAAAGITTIIWATGFAPDYGWMDISPDAFDAKGMPRHADGVSVVPGMYFVGLNWLSCRGSAFIWGAWRDAERLAGVIAARA